MGAAPIRTRADPPVRDLERSIALRAACVSDPDRAVHLDPPPDLDLVGTVRRLRRRGRIVRAIVVANGDAGERPGRRVFVTAAGDRPDDLAGRGRDGQRAADGRDESTLPG